MSQARIFTADYDRSGVAMRVWAPLGIASVLGMTGLFLGQPLLSLSAAIFTLVALRSWPLTREDRPALKLAPNGAEIDGLGLVKWSDIESANYGMVEVKNMRMPALDISLRRPLVEAFEETDATRLRPWEFRIFRLRRDGQIRLDLSKINESPGDIEQAFRFFLSGPH